MSESKTEIIIRQMFKRLLNAELNSECMEKLVPVVDGFLDNPDLGFDDFSDKQKSIFRAMLCSMLAHGWGIGMHPHNNTEHDLDGNQFEVRVSKDILIPMTDIKSLRFVQKDDDGRVSKALFEPDQNVRIRKQIDEILAEISNQD